MITLYWALYWIGVITSIVIFKYSFWWIVQTIQAIDDYLTGTDGWFYIISNSILFLSVCISATSLVVFWFWWIPFV